MARSLAKDSIPTGWKYDLLDRFATRCSGHTPSKSFPEYWNGGIKWISLADSFRLDQGYVYETDKEISEAGIANSSAELHPAETVVLSRDAGIGKSGVMAVPMAVSQHFIAWKCDNSEKLNSWFLYNWLQLNKAEFERQAVGSTIKTIGLPYFKKLKIAVPPYAEQKKIAQILSTWDKATTTTEQLLSNSQQQKKALMQQLLTGKKRLLDKNGVRFSGEWETSTLSNFGKSIRGVSYRPENITEKESKDTIRLLRSTNIQNGNLNDKDLVILPKELIKPNQILKKGDLVICMANGSKALVGKSAPFEGSDITYTVGAFCAIFRPTSGNNTNFVKFLFESSQYQSQLLLILAGSSINNLKGADIESINIFVPICVEEQQRIASVLSTADQEISLLQQKLVALKQEKIALMQQLLTGKRRVKLNEEKSKATNYGN